LIVNTLFIGFFYFNPGKFSGNFFADLSEKFSPREILKKSATRFIQRWDEKTMKKIWNRRDELGIFLKNDWTWNPEKFWVM
jgi:hypothetical protein